MEGHIFSHVGEKPYQCLSCAKSLISQYHLKRHGVIHRRVIAFDCSMCGKSFNDKGNLQQHMRSHTGQKPYKCSTWEQTFTWKNQMKNHMPMHTSEKYYCIMCHIVSYLEIALCSMHGMIWEDTDALFVGIYTLLSWIYFRMNKLMLLNQNNFSVKTQRCCFITLYSS
jgi:hypothetical protein